MSTTPSPLVVTPELEKQLAASLDPETMKALVQTEIERQAGKKSVSTPSKLLQRRRALIRQLQMLRQLQITHSPVMKSSAADSFISTHPVS